jgi:hypothetical protein
LGATGLNLDLQEHSTQQSLALVRASRKRSLAEELVALRELKETSTVRKALRSYESEHGPTPHYEAQQALAIARTVRSTLSAQRRLASARINEAKLYLRALCDSADDVKAKFTLADQQLGELLNEMDLRGLFSIFPDYEDYEDEDEEEDEEDEDEEEDEEDEDEDEDENDGDDYDDYDYDDSSSVPRRPQHSWSYSDDVDNQSDASGLEIFYDAESDGDGG